jgi:nucleoid-associated protein YgaU
MDEYIVQYGDTLPVIAKNELGNEARWLEIAQLNCSMNTFISSWSKNE